MKKLPYALLATIIACLSATPISSLAKDWQSLSIAVDGDNYPFSKADSAGQLTGFDIDAVNAICSEMQIKCTFIKTPKKELLSALANNKFDAAITGTQTINTQDATLQVTKPYFQAPARFVAHKGSPALISAGFMAGKVIGVETDSVYDKYVTANFPSATIKRYKSVNDIFRDLIADKLNYILIDAVVASEGIIKKDTNFEFVGSMIRDEKWFSDGTGFATTKANSDLQTKLNTAIKSLKESGSLLKIQNQYFKFNVYSSRYGTSQPM